MRTTAARVCVAAVAFLIPLLGCGVAATAQGIRGEGVDTDCYEDVRVVLRCNQDVCAFEPHPNEDLVLTRGAVAVAPPQAGQATRWWGNPQEQPRTQGPVFVIPWKQAPRVKLLPAEMEKAKPPQEKHHIFPQAFKKWFKEQGIDVHEYTMLIAVSTCWRADLSFRFERTSYEVQMNELVR